MKRNIVTIALLLNLCILQSCGNTSAETKTKEPAASDKTELPVNSTVVIPEVKENWNYTESVDEMDNSKTFVASTESPTRVMFDFPYEEDGGSKFFLGLRKTGKVTDAYIQVSKGQFLTSLMGGKNYRVKFDDEAPVKFEAISASDGSSNIAFIGNAKNFIQRVSKAKKIIIEAEFFDHGNEKITFDVEGLKWQ
jgi:hypothetical protein